MNNELFRYRGEPYAGEDHFDGAMKWLLKKKHTYPRMFVVASAFLCITVSQIENERSFSVAGGLQGRDGLDMVILHEHHAIYHIYQTAMSLGNVNRSHRR